MMNQELFEAHIENLRRFGPTWASLRVIGNSRPVQIATIFPVVGYFILLSTQFTDLIDGGIAGDHSGGGMWARLWSLKLYFVYFGLIALGVGSLLYQLRCPRIVKSYGNNTDYVREDGSVMTGRDLKFMARETVPIEGMLPSDALRPENKIPVMTNYYAAESHSRPWSRVFTTIFFYGGFALLAVPSTMTFAKVARLLVSQLL